MSSDVVMQRTRVLRGAAAAQIRGAALDADLSLLRPILPVTQTASDVEDAARRVRDEASRVGYEDGYAAGRARAAAEAKEELEALTAAARATLEALGTAAADLAARQAPAVADVEQAVTTLALQIAEGILARELRATDAPAREAITRALQLAPERADIVLRINPADIDTVGDPAALASERAVTLVADGSVERGGCVLDVGPCRIDAQVGPALQRVREVLEA